MLKGISCVQAESQVAGAGRLRDRIQSRDAENALVRATRGAI